MFSIRRGNHHSRHGDRYRESIPYLEVDGQVRAELYIRHRVTKLRPWFVFGVAIA